MASASYGTSVALKYFLSSVPLRHLEDWDFGAREHAYQWRSLVTSFTNRHRGTYTLDTTKTIATKTGPLPFF